jgi:hypothetical protein
MSIYLDGVRIFAGVRVSRDKPIDPAEAERIPDLRRFISVNDIEAIEVYRSAAGIPIQFGGASGQCGAVVLWTKRAPEARPGGGTMMTRSTILLLAAICGGR